MILPPVWLLKKNDLSRYFLIKNNVTRFFRLFRSLKIHRCSKKKIRIFLLLFFLFIITTPFSWVFVDHILKTTGDARFCAGCHTMRPITESYLLDVHGGNNINGVKTACVDCHLPHNNRFNYLYAKAKTGFHDVWAQLFFDLSKIDWIKKRDNRQKFVFDSGCLACHTELEKATMANIKAFVAHKPYFLQVTLETCVSCHKNVGHKDLADFINKTNNLPKDWGP